jgi:hypothetical protein
VGTGRDDRRQLVDLRDPYQRPHIVDEFWWTLCLDTVRKSRLVVDEKHRRIV